MAHCYRLEAAQFHRPSSQLGSTKGSLNHFKSYAHSYECGRGKLGASGYPLRSHSTSNAMRFEPDTTGGKGLSFGQGLAATNRQ